MYLPLAVPVEAGRLRAAATSAWLRLMCRCKLEADLSWALQTKHFRRALELLAPEVDDPPEDN